MVCMPSWTTCSVDYATLGAWKRGELNVLGLVASWLLLLSFSVVWLMGLLVFSLFLPDVFLSLWKCGSRS